MDKTQNKSTGRLGEDLAEKFLRRKGYRVISRNFSTRYGELDLIGTKDGRLVFIEVKTKIGDRFGQPEEMINRKKVSQIMRIAQSFILRNKEIASKYPLHQVDAVCIVLGDDNSLVRLDHYENIGE
ncbi:MAG: hypothetical protein UV74_C0013G0589 [Candidatus Woesebacteria bacterium GW2011_GWB1_43_14]|uniref:UPF0102 protein UV74_C0013G0589 n=1 Tax=Candidatus Woesebacteria bacterium GW2011_GWB1_43_14 TaxID=1618578 RepID=A0A0G1DIP6_9BACT|nr:MAG: hypothetical protein UV51_C0008G0011 [Candidatus Woesebacteria bacterium GW2011_GWC1_42_9]KKS97467.1 MAG: hypothetical protein UV74_C0013G0589 [Candidatus Woesebacteria bacterium GW2011_GWB1_43_14]